MHRIPLLAPTVVTFVFLGFLGPDHAYGTPQQICAGAKQKAAGKAAVASLTCHAKAATKGIGTDPTCLAKVDAKLATAFAKAESRGGCDPTGDAGAIDALLGSSVDAIVLALRPLTDANRCAGLKLKATGKNAQKTLACHARATGRGLDVDPACLAKTETHFVNAFAKAEGRPPCLTTGDEIDVQALVDDLVNSIVSAGPLQRTPCEGGSGFPTCDGACPDGEQCGLDVDVSPSLLSCSCFPIDVTPCGGSDFPQCGGVCFGDHVCQAFGGSTSSGFCGCAAPTTPCGGGPFGMCTGDYQPGVCPSGMVCVIPETTPPLCGCATP